MSDSDEGTETVYVIDEDMKAQIAQISKALWIGNGKPSLMTRIEALEGKMAVVVWASMAFGVLILGYLFSILTHTTQVGP